MDMDFIRIPRRPTPEQLLEAIVQIVPEFALHWERPGNDSLNVDVVFKGQVWELSDTQRRMLFEFVEKCVVTDPYAGRGVSNAACTCFLENLAGEGDLSRAIAPYLGTKSKEYFDEWN
jgi:hypothetical protein